MAKRESYLLIHIKKRSVAKIGLIDVDNTGFPNLALMKISAYHKTKGDDVAFVNVDNYDRTYISKIFTYTSDYIPSLSCLGEVVKGGTGYDLTKKLPDEIETSQPDYGLYGISDTSYGFITRGCNRKCAWCVVPQKEGKPKNWQTVEDMANGNSKLVLLDNNILASKFGVEQIKEIARLGLRVDFNQGLDARLVTDEIADLLVRVKYIKSIRFACDSAFMTKITLAAMQKLVDRGVKKYRFSNYILLNDDIEDSYARAKAMRDFGVHINPQPYRTFNRLNDIPQWQKDFARWGSKKQIYDATDFKDYEPRKGFLCSTYFNGFAKTKARGAF